MNSSQSDVKNIESVDKNEQQSHENTSVLKNKKKPIKQLLKFPLFTAIVGIFFVVVISIFCYSFFQGLSFNFGSGLFAGITGVFGKDLKRDSNGHTNILLVGIGGAEHDGANLTDTMMVASIDHEKNTVALLSIPRDLYLSVPHMGTTKINAVYDFALRKDAADVQNTVKGNSMPTFSQVQTGMNELQNIVENVTGVEIQYFLKVDFQGFIEVVDLLGGIDVDVPRDLIDKEYPNESYGYETFAVRKGPRHFDGKTALKYARSRHSTSDFDRSERQHLIMKAVLKKLEDKQYLTNPSQLKRIYYAVSENIVTNLDLRELLSIAGVAKSMQKDHILSAGFHDDVTRIGGFLYVPQRALFGGASVLLPSGATAGNLSYYKKMQLFAHMFLFSQEYYVTKPRILIVNATKSGTKRLSGVGQSIKSSFAAYGIDIEESVNAPEKVALDETQIIAMNTTSWKIATPLIELIFPAKTIQYEQNTVQDTSLASFLEEQKTYDVVIVVGKDFKELLSGY